MVAPQVDQVAIGDVIQSLADAVDVVICDLQGSASVAMLHAIHYADLVLIPVQPSNDDLKSAHSTARHVAQAGKSARREIPYRIVIESGVDRFPAGGREGRGGGACIMLAFHVSKRRFLNEPRSSAPASAAWRRSSTSQAAERPKTSRPCTPKSKPRSRRRWRRGGSSRNGRQTRDPQARPDRRAGPAG